MIDILLPNILQTSRVTVLALCSAALIDIFGMSKLINDLLTKYLSNTSGIALTHKAPPRICSRQKFQIFPLFQKKIRHDISWELSAGGQFSWIIMPFFFFWKSGKIWNFCLLQILGGALRVKGEPSPTAFTIDFLAVYLFQILKVFD